MGLEGRGVVFGERVGWVVCGPTDNLLELDYCILAKWFGAWWYQSDGGEVIVSGGLLNVTNSFFVDNPGDAFYAAGPIAAYACYFKDTLVGGGSSWGWGAAPVTLSDCLFSGELPADLSNPAHILDGGGNLGNQIIATLALECATQSRTPMGSGSLKETAPESPTETAEPTGSREPTPSRSALPIGAIVGATVAVVAVLGLAAAAAVCIVKYRRGSRDSASGRSCADLEVAHPTVPVSVSPFSGCPTQENPLCSNDRRLDDSDCVHA